MTDRDVIAARAARELRGGLVANLGFGMPTLVDEYVPSDVKVILQSENGMLEFAGPPERGFQDCYLANAGGEPLIEVAGSSYFDIAESFCMIRGGHIDLCLLGALEVDEKGDIANWLVPGKRPTGMGGAMDLLVGAKHVVVMMEHNAKDGSPKLVRECALPLSAVGAVNRVITEKGVFDIGERGFVLREISPFVTVEELKLLTGADFMVDEDPQPMFEEVN